MSVSYNHAQILKQNALSLQTLILPFAMTCVPPQFVKTSISLVHLCWLARLVREAELTGVSLDPVQLGEGLCCVGVDVADHLVPVTVREADDERLVVQH